MPDRSARLSPLQHLPDVARWRLYVAAPLSELAAARTWEALADVRTRHPLVRWLPPNKLHLTLVFLGPTDPSDVDSVSAACAHVAAHQRPFDVATGQAGGRVGGRGGGVAWLKLPDGGREVARLSLELDEAIWSHTFDANKPPHPHLTVARGVSKACLWDLQSIADTMRLTWTVDRIALFRSHTDPAGSRYAELASATLNTGA